ncbi:hypothetical protein MMK25_24305 [Bacillus cereus]|nr:hypothetical protein [Bacillus cereus]
MKKKIDLFKDMYYYELEQKEKINNRITIPIAIITLLVGLAVYYFKGLPNIETNFWGCIFFVIYGIYILLIFVSIWFIFKAYYNYKYSYLPTPEVIEGDINKIITYYDENYEEFFKETGSKQELIERDIDETVSSYYIKATSSNIPHNESKLKLLRYAGNTLIIAVFFAAVSIVPYQIAFKDTKEIKVEVKQLNEFYKLINEGIKK